MYAISHAASALLIKRRWPAVGLLAALFCVQAIELLWVVFVYLGIEKPEYTANAVHLGFLPYSHSVGSTILVAVIVWACARWQHKRPAVALALAVAVLSHVVLDIIHHEPDIRLLPAAVGPRMGLSLANVPLLDFGVELAFGIFCWGVFRGGVGLLIAIVALNVADLPLMLPPSGIGTMLGTHPAVLPTIILFQIVLTWAAV
jgi:hypothetical protein